MNFISSTYIQINNSTKIRNNIGNENNLKPLRLFEFLTPCHFDESSLLLADSSESANVSSLLEYLGL
ncbi:MAG: hypothetical protein KDC81_10975 [Flavobacteriaceae bacterium]|nr:hypothetical protein [Flavobacteriaceae bacterium]